MAHQFGLESAYARADAYLKAGQAHQPAALFRKVLEHPGILVNSINCPLALLQLVRTQVMMGGDTEAARKSYHDFPTLWKDAAPDTPIL